MSAQRLNLAGKEFVVIDREQYDMLLAGAVTATDDDSLPPLPSPDANGNVPAIDYGRVLLARRMILARRRAELTQVELARRAKIRVETLNRLEKGRHNPDATTFKKIETALNRAGARI